jgi:hypothetical protein
VKNYQSISIPVGVKFFTVLRIHAVYDSHMKSVHPFVLPLLCEKGRIYGHGTERMCIFSDLCCALTPRSTVFLHKLISSSSVIHKISRTSQNPKVHKCVHNSPPIFSMLNHINLTHAIPAYFFNITLNIIHSSTSRSS